MIRELIEESDQCKSSSKSGLLGAMVLITTTEENLLCIDKLQGCELGHFCIEFKFEFEFGLFCEFEFDIFIFASSSSSSSSVKIY